MTTFAENWNLNEKDMYILVNRRPLNALNLDVTTIIKFDQNRLEYLRFDDDKSSIILDAAQEAGLCSIESETILSNYPHTEEKRICLKEGYFFTVSDGRYYICSKFYETETAAEEARDKLLLMANKIIARLYKVEI